MAEANMMLSQKMARYFARICLGLMLISLVFWGWAGYQNAHNPVTVCQKMVSEVAASLPLRVDEYTVVTKMECIRPMPFADSSHSAVVQRYSMVLDVAENEVPQENIDAFFSEQLKLLCMDSARRKVVKLFDVEFVYQTLSGAHLAGFVYRGDVPEV